jgi:cytochrome c oxidase subunit 2
MSIEAEPLESLYTALHEPGPGWDDRLPRDKRRWWVFFWLYSAVMAIIALAWFWLEPQHEIPWRNRAVSPAAFQQQVDAFVAKYRVSPNSDVVQVPPGQDAYLEGRMWQWYPTLELKSGVPYTIWLSSTDVTHSLVIGGQHLVFDAVPGHEYGVRLTPGKPGTYLLYCAEYCGLGHQDMAGRLIVTP